VLQIDKGTPSTPSTFQQLCLRLVASHISVDVKYQWRDIRASPVERNVGCFSFFSLNKECSKEVVGETVSAVVVSSKDERSGSITYRHRIYSIRQRIAEG
jgi:hypothetical protein